MPSPPVYLNRADIARILGLATVRSLSGTNLPAPDVIVGTHQGWKRKTVEDWIAARPGKGRRGAR